MKQDKSYYFNNLYYDNDFNAEIITELIQKKDITPLNIFTGNSNILNSIIDPDIAYFYNNNGISLSENGIKQMLITKIERNFN